MINTPISLVPSIKGCPLYITKRNITSYSNCGDAYPMYIGLTVLNQLRLYFAVRERMLYYTAADSESTSQH